MSSEICFNIIDPCDPPSDLLVPAYVTPQTYTLIQTGQGYNAPEFTTDPSYCLVTCTNTITTFTDRSGLTGQSGVIDLSTTSDRNFGFFWDKDDSPLSNTQRVTVSCTTGSKYQT